MHKLTEKAREILIENGYTAVLCSEDKIYNSTERGVKPLIEFLESGVSFRGFAAADKTVGLGAAHLYILLGVSSLFARVISVDARELLASRGVAVFYDTEVPYIVNREGVGRCPIEEAVLGITDPRDALSEIKSTLKRLKEEK